ncbi:MAG: GtrA family protein [Emergencia sp.]
MNYLKHSQPLRYVITGGATTLVNYILYYVLIQTTQDYLIANCIAWTGAVLFAFFANRTVVFQSRGSKATEFFRFVSLRLATLLVENVLLILFVECIGAGELISKVAVSVVTVLLNYFACKYSIFKERGVSHE